MFLHIVLGCMTITTTADHNYDIFFYFYCIVLYCIFAINLRFLFPVLHLCHLQSAVVIEVN